MADTIKMLERAALVIACICCALLAILSLLDLLLRSLGMQFYLASEGNGYLMGWLIFSALPFVARSRSHIKVDFLLDALSPPARRRVEVFNHLVTLVFIGTLIVLCGKVTLISFTDGLRAQGILRIPTFYPFLGIMIGFALLFVTQLATFVEAVRAAWSAVPEERPQ